jgi:hypothetical protein
MTHRRKSDSESPRYFRWNRKSDLKDWGRDGESNKAFPLTPPSPPYVFSVLPASGWQGHGRKAFRPVIVAFLCDRFPFRRQDAGSTLNRYSPPGKGRTFERFVNVRGMSTSIPRLEARRQSVPTNNSTTERPGALSLSRQAEWFSLSLRERVGVRGKELPSRLRLSFQRLAPALISLKIARNRLYCGIPLGFKVTALSKT